MATGDTAGDIVKEEGLIEVVLTVKSAEDIEKGEICCDDGSGNGMVAATTSLVGPYYMARQAHDYSEETDHDIPFVKAGHVVAQAKPASAIAAAQYVELSTTAGEITLSDETAFDDVVGVAEEAALTTATTCRILLGAVP